MKNYTFTLTHYVDQKSYTYTTLVEETCYLFDMYHNVINSCSHFDPIHVFIFGLFCLFAALLHCHVLRC